MFDRQKAQKFLCELYARLSNGGYAPFLIQGTALGVYRDNGFTPTERDVDIGILSENWSASSLCMRLITYGFDVETITAPYKYARTIVARKYGIKADIVSFQEIQPPEDIRLRFALTPVDPVNVPKPYAIVHPAEMFESPYYQASCFGMTFNLPAPIVPYLIREYGEGWQTPREDHVSRARVYGFADIVKELRPELFALENER